MILALTTSGPRSSLALRGRDGSVAASAIPGERSRGRDLAPAVCALLASRGASAADLAAVAVDVGPGSFTGVRVGVATAKALAFAVDAPVVPVPSLAVLAAAAPPDRAVLALRDAGRGTYYHAVYEAEADGRRAERSAPARGDADAIRALAAGLVLVGEEAVALAAALDLGGALDAEADARALLALARPRLLAGETVAAHDVAPLYLQLSAAQRRRAQKAP